MTYTTATNKFLKSAADWLTDEDAPAIESLKAMAKLLDKDFSPALQAQYGLTYRSLRKLAPAKDNSEADDSLLSPGDE